MDKRIWKRVVSILLCLSFILSFASCSKKENGTKIDEKNPAAKKEEIKKEISLKLSKEELPRIDGATAMIPYYEELAARLLDSTTEDVRQYLMYNNTIGAYKNLAEGKADLIFCAPPSDEQVEYAKKLGVEIESVQVLNSGFVFFVNKSNPVNKLTKEQIHDIYAGKITNWKEVGGNDEEIIAYQRKEGSGSQSGLYLHVIPQDEVMDAPTERMIADMGGIIDAVAGYTNASGAIGYSYYYYVMNMHYEEEVKLIAVDGVLPTNQTISSGIYPFISKTAAHFNKNQAADSVVRKIVEWCSGEGGEKLAEDLGYVPSKDSTTPFIVAKEIKPFHEATTMVLENNLTVEEVRPDSDENRYHWYVQYHGLKDKAVEEKVNKALKDAFDMLSSGSVKLNYRGMDAVKDKQPYTIDVSVSNTASFNNILSVTYNVWYAYNDNAEEIISYSILYPLNFDLNTGNQIKLSDLFKNAKNGMEYVNTSISNNLSLEELEINEDEWWYGEELLLVAPFTGIAEDHPFALDNYSGNIVIYFDYNDSEFYSTDYAQSFYISSQEYIDYEKYLGKKSIFEDETAVYRLLTVDYDYLDTVFDEGEISNDGDKINGYYHCSYHEDMNKAAIEFAKFDRELFDIHYLTLKEKMSGIDQSWYPNLFGNMDYRASITRYGDLYNVCVDISSYFYGHHDDFGNDSTTDYYWANLYHVFKGDDPKELSLEDIFKPGTNYKEILKKAMRQSLDSNEMFDFDKNAEGLEALIEDCFGGILNFWITNDALHIQFTDMEGRIAKFLPNEEPNNAYMYESMLGQLSFRSIGCENLTIFK